MSHLSIFSTREIPAVIAAIVFRALFVSGASASAQIRPRAQPLKSRYDDSKNSYGFDTYPPIVPSSLSSTLTSKAHELQQEAFACSCG